MGGLGTMLTDNKVAIGASCVLGIFKTAIKTHIMKETLTPNEYVACTLTCARYDRESDLENACHSKHWF